MQSVTILVLLLALFGVAACGGEALEPPPATAPPASSQVPDAVAPMARAKPAQVVRLWLDAAKRGDAEAMSALWAEVERSRVMTSPHAFAAQVASGTLRAATWHVGAEAGMGKQRTVTVHVVWREHPAGGDNLEFRFAQRDGRWWIVGIAHYD